MANRWGLLSTIELGTALDLQAPAAPTLLGPPMSDGVRFNGQALCPNRDEGGSNGEPRTGLSMLRVIGAPLLDGVDQFEGLSTVEEAMAVMGAVSTDIPLSDADWNVVKDYSLQHGTVFGGWSFVAAAADNTA